MGPRVSSRVLKKSISFVLAALSTSGKRETSFVNCEQDSQDVRDRRDSQFEVPGSKFRTLQPSVFSLQITAPVSLTIYERWGVVLLVAVTFAGLIACERTSRSST